MSMHVKQNKPRPYLWSDREMAFVFCYTDTCIDEGKDYRDYILNALKTFSGRETIRISSLEKMLRKLLREWRHPNPDLQVLLKQGTSYMKDLRGIPEGVQVEINGMIASRKTPLALEEAKEEITGNSDEYTVHDDEIDSQTEAQDLASQEGKDSAASTQASEAKLDQHATLKTIHIGKPEPALERPIAPSQLPHPLTVSPASGTTLVLQGEKLKGRLGTTEPDQSALATQANVLRRAQSDSLPAPSQSTASYKITTQKRKATASTNDHLPKKPRLLEADGDSDPPQFTQSEHSNVPQLASQSSKEDIEKGAMQMQLDIVLDVVRDIVGWQLDEKGPLEQATRIRFRRFLDNAKEPSTFHARQADDLRVSQRMIERLTRWLQDLVQGADLDLGVTFPSAPDVESLKHAWTKFMHKLRRAVNVRDEEPAHLPTPESAGYLTACFERLLSDSLGHDEVDDIIEDAKEHLQSPYAVQALMGVLYCRELFRSPEPMCDPVTSGLMQVYDLQRVTKGMTKVQQLDRVVSMKLFKIPEHQLEEQKRAAAITVFLDDVLQGIDPRLEGFKDFNTNEAWILGALQLKKELLISPDEYRIRIAKAGSAFNPAWMTGVGKDSRDVHAGNLGSRKVALCLFPAIWGKPSELLDDDAAITDALVSHRRFLPTPGERRGFSLGRCIAKATVLVM